MDKDWRCQRYGPLGWMESIIKVVAVGVGIGSLAVFDATDRVLRATRITQIVFMALVGVIILGELVQRVMDKELFALALKGLQFLGHWIMVLVLILSKDPGAFIFTFCFLMILAELIRICFLFLAENIEMKFMTKPILFAISGALAVGQLITLILQIVIWLTEYNPNN